MLVNTVMLTVVSFLRTALLGAYIPVFFVPGIVYSVEVGQGAAWWVARFGVGDYHEFSKEELDQL